LFAPSVVRITDDLDRGGWQRLGVPGRSFRVARIAGIPVGVSPLWLIIVALFTWSLGEGYYPGAVPGISPAASYALGLASVLLLFASILAHEFGHALVARRCGVEIEEIDLWLLGGVARMSGRPQNPSDELRYAAAGPAVTALIAAVFGALALTVPTSVPRMVRAVVAYEAEVNLFILGFNLLPAFPLDGGRIARAMLWRRNGDLGSATDTAASLGRGFGYLLIALGVVSWLSGAVGGLWFTVVGFFLVTAAGAERVQEHVVAALTGIAVRELMSAPVITIPSTLALDQAQRYFERYRYTAFPVIDPAGYAVGLLSIERLERTPRSPWHDQLVGELADRDPALLVDEHDDVTTLLERPAFARVGRAAVIDASHRPIGIVSITDIQRAIRATRPHNGNTARHRHLAPGA
jgi:Zn-dependent protease/CBS domain-containing protein